MHEVFARVPSAVARFSLTRCTSFTIWSLVVATTLHAAPRMPENLGSGLADLVESNLVLAGLRGEARNSAAPFNGYATEAAAGIAPLAISNADGRYMVRINPDPSTNATALAGVLAAQFPELQVVTIDSRYRQIGVLDGWVSLDDVPAMATYPGVRSLILELKPRHHAHAAPVRPAPTPATVGPGNDDYAGNGATFTMLGTVFDEGVIEHRIDQINQFYNPSAPFDYEGSGMQIGIMSDSYARAAANAMTDVTKFDLPGAANNPVNTTAVVVLQEGPTGGSDEGRGMAQIAYKMAPKAALAFATADMSEAGFAKNIRALAGLAGSTYAGQTFAADVICDDVGYYDEPYYEDGILSLAVNDVVAAGVSYFSAAGNGAGLKAYESPLRWVANGTGLTAAAGNTALANTNIDLTGVTPAYYAGGFHNFNPANGARDIAQRWNWPTNRSEVVSMQWDEPYDGAGVNTDINLLVFNASGAFVTALHTNNISTNMPYEIGTINNGSSTAQLQFVISRTAVPSTPGATRVEYMLPSDDNDVGIAEYFQYANVTTVGHEGAAGGNGVAAYAFSELPNTTEYFSSAGPVTITLDSSGNRLITPELRQQPTIAATDGVSNTVFTDKFYGTSAAAPHAAAIAALVLQAHGGRRSVTPAQMTTMLQRSAFVHDLDPYYASGVARTSGGGKVSLRVRSGVGVNPGTGARDANAIQLSYAGNGGITVLTLNPTGSPLTAGNVDDGSFAVTTTPALATYTETRTGGLTLATAEVPFTVGSASLAPTPTPNFNFPYPASQQYYSLQVSFTPPAMLTATTPLAFTVGRLGTTIQFDIADASADLFGGGVATPSGTVAYHGMSFSGSSTTGAFSGTLKNRLGAGYSPLDGYGFINAQNAVQQVLP